LKKASAIIRKYYDQNKEQATDFKTGDKVWLEGTNMTTLHPMKLDNKHYSLFTILEKMGTSSYKLQLLSSWSHIHNIFNEVLLLPFTPPTFPSQQPPLPTPCIKVAGNIEYKVELIQNSR
jgi:hypothetical protein